MNRPLSKRKNRKIIWLKKDELGEKVMKEILGLSGKTYSYLIDDESEHKKAKDTKKSLIIR